MSSIGNVGISYGVSTPSIEPISTGNVGISYGDLGLLITGWW